MSVKLVPQDSTVVLRTEALVRNCESYTVLIYSRLIHHKFPALSDKWHDSTRRDDDITCTCVLFIQHVSPVSSCQSTHIHADGL